MNTLVDLIAEHIRNNYTFISSDGKPYKSDGFDEAYNFIESKILSQVDSFIKESYSVKEDDDES